MRPDPYRQPSPPQDGFTLIEMVVAISLIAVIFAAAAGVMTSGLRSLAAAKTRAQANNIATQGIEDLQRFGFNNLGVCGTYAQTPPADLVDTVTLPNCPSPTTTPPVTACDSVVFGSTPAKEYTCTNNNVSYGVRRYVAWVDPLRTTKRLAVFVDWVDLAGNHQVSQQSSLRAPDQRAILGLDPPLFTSATPPSATPSPSPVPLDATNSIASGGVALAASVANVYGPATAGLSTTIPTHAAGNRFTINITPGASAFPDYNGFKVTIGSGSSAEIYTVIQGAGTTQWSVQAEGTVAHGAGSSTVAFTGDKVYATFGTLDAAGDPESSTLLLAPVGPNSANGQPNWATTLDAADGFRFGAGTQYFSFGILRAADGKSTAAFATPDVPFCLDSGSGCAAAAAPPSLTSVSAPATVDIDDAGALLNDIPVSAQTTNVSAADTVSVSFITHAGVISVILQPDASCPLPSTATPGVTCTWTGSISRTGGYRLAATPQRLYFAARQVNQPGSIDTGSTAARATASTVAFS